jgi:hypothetical protein
MDESIKEEAKLMETLQQKSKTDNPEKPELKLVDIEVTNENMALNLLVSFVHLAQRRGAFNMDEAAKIWECIKKFQKPAPI